MLFIFNSVSSVMNFCNYCKWPYPVAKFTIYASCSTWWPNLQLMQVVPPDGKIYSKCKFCHLMTTFTTYVKVSGDSKCLSFCLKKLILRLWANQNRPPLNQIPVTHNTKGFQVWSCHTAPPGGQEVQNVSF